MTFLYDARYSVVLLRPKNEVKLLTQSAAKWICMGKWAFEIWAHLTLKDEKAPDNRTFFAQCGRYYSPGLQRFHQENSSRAKKKVKCYLYFFIFAKITTIRPRTPNFWPGQTSIALPILVRRWQMMAL